MNMKRVHFGKRSRASNLFNAALTEEENNTPPRYNMKMKPSFNFTTSSIQPRLQTLAEGLDDEKVYFKILLVYLRDVFKETGTY